MSLVNEIVEEAPLNQAAAWKRYADLLRRDDPTDKPELKALLKDLKVSPTQAKADKAAQDSEQAMRDQLRGERRGGSRMASVENRQARGGDLPH